MFNSMFDELIKVLQINNRFQEPYVKYFKEKKRLKSLQKVEEYLEPKQASMIELFCEYS